MKSRVGMLSLVIAFVAFSAVTAWSANSITVKAIPDAPVAKAATGVEIGVFVDNDVQLSGLVLPLELRTAGGGGYIINNFSFAVQGRVGSSGLMDFVVARTLGVESDTADCSGPTSSSYALDNPIDFVSPGCVFWSGVNTMNPYMAIGTDGTTPSFLFTVDVTDTDGNFEIDTCCVTPANHLQYVDASYLPVIPVFNKGLITIGDGNAVHEIAGSGPLPTTFALGQNYPNPFNATTMIPFEVGYNSHVQIDIYDILGRQIATVVDDDYPQGRYIADWNGTNRSGKVVATGVYFYRLVSDETVTTRKMVLLK